RHERLALALEASDEADPEALFFHWHGAGNREKAGRFAIAAAAEAAGQLAFDRAARLYATALELGGRGDRDLVIRHADALANAGRGVEAAEAYLEAAAGADPALAIDLRRRASEGFLRSGHVDRGLDTVREVLREVGISLPRTPTRALLALLW